MKILYKIIILYIFLSNQFVISKLDLSQVKLSFEKVLEYIQKKDKIKILDIPLLNKVSLPPQIKNVADQIFIEKPHILFDKNTKSIFLIGGMQFKNKLLVTRLRFGLSSDQELNDMKGLKKNIEKDKKDKDKEKPKKSFKEKLVDAKEKIRGFKDSPKEKIKKGIKDKGKIGVKKIVGKLALSFSIELPGNWNYFDFMPGVKEKLPTDMQKMIQSISFENNALIISIGDYEDPEFGAIQSGINVIGTPRYGGDLKKLEKVFGKDFGKLEFRGLIAANLSLAGSFLKATVPWNIPLIKPNKNLDLKVTTNGITFIFGIQEFVPFAPVPRLKIQTGVNVLLPKHSKPFDLDGFLDVYPQKAEFAGVMNGFIGGLMGVPIKIGNLGLGFTLDFAALAESAAATAGAGALWPIHGGSIKGGLQVGDKTVDIGGKFEFSGSGGLGDLILSGNYEGELERKDVVKFIVETIQLGGKISGKYIDLDKVASKVEKIIPQFKLMDSKFIVSYKDGELLGDQYHKGLHLKSGFYFGPFGTNDTRIGGSLELMGSSKGIKILGHIPTINLGNGSFFIDGSGLDKKRGTSDDGPIISGEISVNNQYFYLDGLLRIPALQVESDSRINLSAAGANVHIEHKLGDFFKAKSLLEGQISDLNSWKIEGSIERNTLTKFGDFLKEAALNMKSDAERDLQKAKNEVEKGNNIAKSNIENWVKEQIQGIDYKLKSLEERIEKAKQRCRDAHWVAKAFVCTGVGTELAALRAKWTALNARREGTKLLKEAAKSGVEIGTGAAQLAIKVAQESANNISKVVDFFGQIVAGGFNITNVDYKGTLKGFIDNKKTPWTRIRGKIGDKSFDHIIEFDFKNPKKSAKNLLQILKSIVLGEKVNRVSTNERLIEISNDIDKAMLVKVLNDNNELSEFEIGTNITKMISIKGSIEEISVRRKEDASGWYHGWNNYFGHKYKYILNASKIKIVLDKIQGLYASKLIGE